MAGRETPVWLNEEFLTAALKDDEGILEVLEHKVEPAIPEGYNWCSSLFRVNLTYKKVDSDETKKASLIVKSQLANGFMREYGIELKFFEKECRMYNEILPEIHGRLGADETVAPRKLFSKDDVLVLEDLNESGYVSLDRVKQMDFDHSIKYMRTLAKYHAGSVALHEANSDLVESIGKELTFTDSNRDTVHGKYFKSTLIGAATSVEAVGTCHKFGKKLRNLSETIWDTLVEIFSQSRHVRVLNHGDAWMSNALFKHDPDGRVVSVKLVDFQLNRYASPGIDIHYFIMTSVREEVRNTRFDELIDEYRKTFNATLNRMQSDVRLSAEQLNDEMDFTGPFGLLVSCSLLPMVLADPTKPAKISQQREAVGSLNVKVNPFMKIYDNEHYKNVIVKQLEFLEERGYF